MPRGLVHVTGSERLLLSYPGSPHHRRFLIFAFEGVAYQYKVLPFGPSLAPCTFTRCMDAALFPLRQIGIRILNYLDDWLILAQSEAVSTLHKNLFLSHLCCLGLRVNFAKSILSPSQRVSFLSTVIDSVQMTATVSAERATTIQSHAASFKEGNARPLKAFERITYNISVCEWRKQAIWVYKDIKVSIWWQLYFYFWVLPRPTEEAFKQTGNHSDKKNHIGLHCAW